MSAARRTQAELVAELRKLRARVDALEREGRELREALRCGEARERHALESAGAAFVELDRKGAVLRASPGVAAVLGYEPDELAARAALEWIHEDYRDEVIELYRRLLADGTVERGIFRARHKTGAWLWIESQCRRDRAPDGEMRGLVFLRDVTALQRADEARRSSEERFRTLAENATDIVSEVDAEGRLLFTTPNSLEILGHAADDLIGRPMIEGPHFANVHPDDRARTLEAYRRALAEGGTGEVEYRYRHANGEWRWLHSRARAYRASDGALRFAVISRDVTERVNVRQALRSSEERYRELTATTHDLVAELDSEGRLVYISPNAVELVGYAPEELVGRPPFELLHPDDLDHALELFRSRSPGHPRRPARFRVRHRDGSSRLFEGSGFDYPSASGEMHLVAVVHDVTDAVRAEQERRELERRSQQARKLEGLGVMAGGIAHDFNNLLTPILGDTSLVMLDLPADSPLRPRLEKVRRAARRAAELTNRLLAYAGEETPRAQLVELSALVAEQRSRFATALPPNVELHDELAPGLPPIEADASQLCQLMVALLTNAAEAIGDAPGRVWLRTGRVEADRRRLARLLFGEELPPGTYVHLEVEDSGTGMDDATRERIFEPFFTTKFAGRGLGLAAALGIVRGHVGAIEIESAPGRGTRLRVLLPAAAEAGAR